jgi:hypothetical protein
MTRLKTFCIVAVLVCCGGCRPGDESMANLERDAERFADCFNALNADCVFELTHVESMVAAGIRSPYVDRAALRQLWSAPQDPVTETVARGMAMFGQAPDERMTSFAALQSGEPFTAGEKLYAFVPFRQTNTSSRGRLEREAFFVSISEDGGASWRFVIVNGLHIPAVNVPRIYPELAGRELPPINNVTIPWPEPAVSEFLRTADGAFEVVPGSAIYALRFDVLKSPNSDVLLMISFDDPAESARPATMRVTLAAGQPTLEVRSPALSGFEPGEHYDIVVVGVDPANEAEKLFEHRQTLLFDPTSEMLQMLASGDGAIR